MKKKYIIILVVSIVLIALDQITKQLIAANLNIGEEIVIIKNFFTITSHRNDGAAWGIFSGNMVFFYFITAAAMGLFYYLFKEVDFNKNKIYGIAVILMFAGGIGNFIDRVLFKEVIDFIDVDIFSYTTFPVFNIADMCLVVGMILFTLDIVIEEIINGKRKDNSITGK